MSSIRPQDRASLCTFTFADGRRCRTPLSSRHPRLCFDHARKAAKAHPVDPHDIDLSFSFSGDYVSTRDLSAAIARLLPDLTHGQMKRKTASAISCLSRTLVRSIQLAQHERIRASAETRLHRPKRPPQNSCQAKPKTNPRRINTYISASEQEALTTLE
jgi:hypothetical protein